MILLDDEVSRTLENRKYHRQTTILLQYCTAKYNKQANKQVVGPMDYSVVQALTMRRARFACVSQAHFG